ncbi:MAG: polysaccharide pyruvyl transferase family protein, partial [Oscillospiraceae bacterium]|nr:polysaccharide pyruvyl transferase family protein [Oscillospiraceae bacterium]
DIVTYLSACISNREKRSDGILYVIRSDIEKYHPAAEIEKMKTQIGYDSADCDTVVRGYIGRIRRRRKLSDFLKKYCRSAAVITDRFHGMVFAVITGTPCVVMRSLDHKVIEGYRWFRFLPYIRFANDASMVPEILQSLMKDTTKIEIPDYNKILCEKKDQNE